MCWRFVPATLTRSIRVDSYTPRLMPWDHGYFSSTSYTSGVYRELAPAWLDFAALLKGHQPPRSHEGEAFAYLELGSGMGLGLCLLAAAYPEGRFTGIDFQPDHIVHSRRLAQQLGLSNIQFQEADFLSLAADPGPLAAAHHYVVAHGIATWITTPIQQALLQLASAALNPGGIFYCSYNTFPGWLAASAFQHLGELTRQRQAEAIAAQAFQQAAVSLMSLLGSEESPSALAQANPALRFKLGQIPNQNAAYLLQEYANEGWQPLYVAELHQRCAAHKLRFHASATLPENFQELLPANVRPAVLAESDPALRQSLQDLAINQSFRRDLFLRGVASSTESELRQRLSQIMLRLQEAPATDTYSFETSFGLVSAMAERYQQLEACLANGPRSFGQLLDDTQLQLAELAKLLALLLHAGRIGFDRCTFADFERARYVNEQLVELMRTGRSYSHLVAPASGGSVNFSLVEAFLLDGQRRHLGGQELEQHLLESLKALGRSIKGEPAPLLSAFFERQPLLQALGVLP
jgi:SAM-dependent methyltransferase